MLDHITVIGNIATVPERRTLPGGITIAKFRLATNHRRLENGEWVDGHTNWYAVTAFRRLAENALNSLERGHRVIVSGRFRLREWDTGEKRGIAAEIDADALGHDLLFGSTVFHRDPSTAPAADAGAVSAETGALSAEPLGVTVGGDEFAPAPAPAPAATWAPPLEEATPY